MDLTTCRFETPRLMVGEWHSLSSHDPGEGDLEHAVMSILTEEVTRALPPEWHGAYSVARARDWIRARDEEGVTLLVVERSSRRAVGLVILLQDGERGDGVVLRLGYLLAEAAWGRGLASELIRGFVDWCRGVGVTRIIGGVATNNPPSRRVLEKCGFVRAVSTGASTDAATDDVFTLEVRSR